MPAQSPSDPWLRGSVCTQSGLLHSCARLLSVSSFTIRPLQSADNGSASAAVPQREGWWRERRVRYRENAHYSISKKFQSTERHVCNQQQGITMRTKISNKVRKCLLLLFIYLLIMETCESSPKSLQLMKFKTWGEMRNDKSTILP